MRTSILVCSLITVVAAAGIVTGVGAESTDPNLLAFENISGQLRTFNRSGAVDLDNPFFQDLGTNGHLPSAGRGVDHYARQRAGALCRDDRCRSDLSQQRRFQLRRRRRHQWQSRCCVQPAAIEGIDPCWHRRPGRCGIQRLVGRRSVRMWRAAADGIGVPAPAALDEPRVSQRGDVGRPRVVGHDDRAPGSCETG